MPLSPPDVHPELPYSLASRIIFALQDRLVADEDLRGVLRGGLEIVELRALLEQENITAPFLGLFLIADSDEPSASSYAGEQQTVIGAVLLTHPPKDLGDTSGMLRSRIALRIRQLVRANFGVLQDGEGDLTLAVTEIRSISFDQAQLPSRLVPTAIQIVYRSAVDLSSQEVY